MRYEEALMEFGDIQVENCKVLEAENEMEQSQDDRGKERRVCEGL